jgi:hypothetical protein
MRRSAHAAAGLTPKLVVNNPLSSGRRRCHWSCHAPPQDSLKLATLQESPNDGVPPCLAWLAENGFKAATIDANLDLALRKRVARSQLPR